MFYCKCLKIFLIQHKISEMRRPIGMKFCTMISSRPKYIMPFQNFGALPKKILGPKTCKIWPISDEFKLWQGISPKWMKIFKIGQVINWPRFLPHWIKNVSWTLVQKLRIFRGGIIHTQIDFFGIFWPLGGAAPQIFTHATEWSCLAIAYFMGWGSPLQFFSKQSQKLAWNLVNACL